MKKKNIKMKSLFTLKVITYSATNPHIYVTLTKKRIQEKNIITKEKLNMIILEFFKRQFLEKKNEKKKFQDYPKRKI